MLNSMLRFFDVTVFDVTVFDVPVFDVNSPFLKNCINRLIIPLSVIDFVDRIDVDASLEDHHPDDVDSHF